MVKTFTKPEQAEELINIEEVENAEVTYVDGYVLPLSKGEWLTLKHGIINNVFKKGDTKIKVTLKNG